MEAFLSDSTHSRISRANDCSGRNRVHRTSCYKSRSKLVVYCPYKGKLNLGDFVHMNSSLTCDKISSMKRESCLFGAFPFHSIMIVYDLKDSKTTWQSRISRNHTVVSKGIKSVKSKEHGIWRRHRHNRFPWWRVFYLAWESVWNRGRVSVWVDFRCSRQLHIYRKPMSRYRRRRSRSSWSRCWLIYISRSLHRDRWMLNLQG